MFPVALYHLCSDYTIFRPGLTEDQTAKILTAFGEELVAEKTPGDRVSACMKTAGTVSDRHVNNNKMESEKERGRVKNTLLFRRIWENVEDQ